MHIICSVWVFTDDIFRENIGRYSDYGEGIL